MIILREATCPPRGSHCVILTKRKRYIYLTSERRIRKRQKRLKFVTREGSFVHRGEKSALNVSTMPREQYVLPRCTERAQSVYKIVVGKSLRQSYKFPHSGLCFCHGIAAESKKQSIVKHSGCTNILRDKNGMGWEWGRYKRGTIPEATFHFKFK